MARTLPASLAALALIALALLSAPVAASADESEGTVDAGAIASLQPITVSVTLDARAHATPREWLFTIEDATGETVEALSVQTSAETPAAAVSTEPLPPGDYRVRLWTGNHVALSCDEDVFYELTSPASGVASIALGSTQALAPFSFSMCPRAPDALGVSLDPQPGPDGQLPDGPADGRTLSRAGGSPDNPLPPDTGTGLARRSARTSLVPAAAVVLLAAGVFTLASMQLRPD